MMAACEEREPYGQAQWGQEIGRAILKKYGDAMLEVIRLTGDNLQLSKQVTELQLEVARLQRILDYLIDTQTRGG